MSQLPSNFYEFYIQSKEILQLKEEINEDQDDFKDKRLIWLKIKFIHFFLEIWDLILINSERSLSRFEKKLNSFGIFFRIDEQYQDAQDLIEDIKKKEDQESKLNGYF